MTEVPSPEREQIFIESRHIAFVGVALLGVVFVASGVLETWDLLKWTANAGWDTDEPIGFMFLSPVLWVGVGAGLLIWRETLAGLALGTAWDAGPVVMPAVERLLAAGLVVVAFWFLLDGIESVARVVFPVAFSGVEHRPALESLIAGLLTIVVSGTLMWKRDAIARRLAGAKHG